MELHQQLREFIVENFLFGRAAGLSDDTSFLDGGIFDSTGVLELISHLEKVYSIHLEDAELVPDNLDSINKVAAFLERRLQQGPIGGIDNAS